MKPTKRKKEVCLDCEYYRETHLCNIMILEILARKWEGQLSFSTITPWGCPRMVEHVILGQDMAKLQ